MSPGSAQALAGRALAAVLVLASVLTGCDDDARKDHQNDVEQVDPDTPVGELVTRWSTIDGDAWVWDASGSAALLQTEHDVEHWLSALPVSDLDLDPVREVDLDSHVLVIGGDGACGTPGQVFPELIDDRPILRYAVQEVVCELAAASLEVWAVAHSDVAGVAPFALSSDPLGVPRSESQRVGSLLGSWAEDTIGSEDLEVVLDEHAGILRTTEEAQAFADALLRALQAQDESVTAQEVALIGEVEMDESTLAVVGYDKCTQTSSVRIQADHNPPLLWVRFTDPEPKTLCHWSPLTIDVWRVPVSDLDGEVESGQYRFDFSWNAALADKP